MMLRPTAALQAWFAVSLQTPSNASIHRPPGLYGWRKNQRRVARTSATAGLAPRNAFACIGMVELRCFTRSCSLQLASRGTPARSLPRLNVHHHSVRKTLATTLGEDSI